MMAIDLAVEAPVMFAAGQETAAPKQDVYPVSGRTRHRRTISAARSCAMRSNALIVGSLFITAALLVGCSSSGASASAPAAATQAPASVAPATEAPASAPAASAPAEGGLTVDAKPVGAAGTVLVDGKSGLTVYTFTKDVKDSGKSNCTGGCIDTWPALTVPAGATPSGGASLTGKLGTITREDDGTLQVTYNGLPLYFFKNDAAPGDANGIYENWEAVKP
jgi:predicted lipoprotein with Yx(FWY)xxD motif